MSLSSYTLGISGFYHDSSAALLQGSRIVAAFQEERFTRKKFDPTFPKQSIQACLREAGCRLKDIDHIVFYDKPFLKFDRILETTLAFAPCGFWSFRKAFPSWIKEKLFLKQVLLDALLEIAQESREKITRQQLRQKLRFSEHHLSHAASAFYPSPFQNAAVLVLDGVGEWATASLFWGEGTKLKALKEIHFPHSLGLLYSAFTGYCGFKVNSGEYKLMGLAPFGKPQYAELIKQELIAIAEDGSFQLNEDYFGYLSSLKMTNRKFHRLFGGRPRKESEPMTQRHKDLAASIQVVTEEVLIKITRRIAQDLPTKNLCLAGGVALNCVANGQILRDGKFENIWVQPAAGDAGGSLGAAYVGYYASHLEASRILDKADSMRGSFLGMAYDDASIQKTLERLGARFHPLPTSQLLQNSVELLMAGKALGWFQGKMEFGPRALGARSILADPRSPDMQSKLNLKIKFRESFRPFAPAIAIEDLGQWFDLPTLSPYMLFTANVKSERLGQIPAVTHVDQSARVQTVHPETNPLFHQLLNQFKRQTGCAVLVNTSFNVRGEPLVASPEDAFRCFMGTDLDALAIGNFLLLKSEQDRKLAKSYYTGLEKD